MRLETWSLKIRRERNAKKSSLEQQLGSGDEQQQSWRGDEVDNLQNLYWRRVNVSQSRIWIWDLSFFLNGIKNKYCWLSVWIHVPAAPMCTFGIVFDNSKRFTASHVKVHERCCFKFFANISTSSSSVTCFQRCFLRRVWENFCSDGDARGPCCGSNVLEISTPATK